MRGALIQLLYCQENPFGERRHLSSFVRAVVSLPFAKTHLTREPVCFVWLRGLSSFSHSSTTESSETGRLPPEPAALSSCHGPSCAYTSDPPAWPTGLLRRWHYYRSTAHFSNGNSANRRGRDDGRRRHGRPSVLPDCTAMPCARRTLGPRCGLVGTRTVNPDEIFNRCLRSSSVLGGVRGCRSCEFLRNSWCSVGLRQRSFVRRIAASIRFVMVLLRWFMQSIAYLGYSCLWD